MLCDTGVLLSLVDRSQPMHRDYRRLVAELSDELVTTWACFTEVMYLSLEKGGWQMQKQVVRYILDGLVVIHDVELEDFDRLYELMEKYQDRPMDLADVTLVLAAEKMRIQQILTLDSDFRFYQINGKTSFQIVDV